MKKNKILFCSPLGEKGAGGISKWTRYIIDYSTKCDTTVELEHFYPATEIIYQNTPPLKRLWHGISFFSGFLVRLGKQLKHKNYDAVHLSSSASLSLLKDLGVISLAHRYGAKAIIHFHFGRIPTIFQRRNWEYKLIDKVIRKADLIIVIDKASFDTLINEGYKNITLLPNVLSTEVADIIKHNQMIHRNPNKIVFAGHVVRTKGVYELIEACKDIPNVQVELYGYVTEEIKSELGILAGEEMASRLVIHGEQPLESVITGMLSCGLFVLPTYSEGFPNVIIESMACACPIITTPVGAIPEMLDLGSSNECGIVVQVKDVKALNAAIKQLLANPQLANELSLNACLKVNAAYSIDVIWEQLERLWLNCVSQKQIN